MKMIFSYVKAFFIFLKNNKHFFMLSYAAVYIPWFCYVEKKVSATSSYHIVHMTIDDYIPFCEFFIIPYFLWFAYMAFGIIYVAFKDGPACWKLGAFLITGMTVFLIISTVYPNGHQLRSTTFARDNIFVTLVKWLYSTDTPTNLFPSIHVYNSIGVHIALLSSERLMKDQRMRRVVVPVSWVLMISIILSTVFLKQHSMFDVLTAFALSALMYSVCFGHLFACIRKSYRKRHPVRETV